MKKTKIITVALGLCMTASLFAGCGGSTTHETAAASLIAGGETQSTIAAAQNVTATGTKFALNYNGYKIYPGMNVDEALSILGDNYDEFAQANCAGQGMGYDYVYDDYQLQLMVPNSNADRSISMIVVEGNLIDCGGVYVGDPIDKAKEVFGEPSQGDEIALIYNSGSIRMTVFSEGTGNITNIQLELIVE